jgi:hypothetical protein
MTYTHAAVTRHWCQRVHERIGDHVDPVQLWRGLRWAIEHGRTDLVGYVGRLDRNGRRAWAFRIAGKDFYLVARNGVPLTVLTPEMMERPR